MTFYFDENIPKYIARALNELEKERTDISVFSTEDVWGKGIKDPQLIENLNEANGILVTYDLRMRYTYRELLKENKTTAFFIAFTKGVNFEHKYKFVFRIWENIKKTARKQKHPFICQIQNNGTLRILD